MMVSKDNPLLTLKEITIISTHNDFARVKDPTLLPKKDYDYLVKPKKSAELKKFQDMVIKKVQADFEDTKLEMSGTAQIVIDLVKSAMESLGSKK